jgi:L-ribulose-5-phosphate 3-epimerase
VRDMPLSRRVFLEATAAGAAVGGLASRGARADEPTGKPEAGKIGDFKISLAEWSLHKALFAKKIDNLDFPKIAREQYGIEGVEFVNQFFKTNTPRGRTRRTRLNSMTRNGLCLAAA